MLKAKFSPKDNSASTVDGPGFVAKGLTQQRQSGNPKIRVVEGIVELSPDHESISFFQFDRLLNREIRIDAPWRNERIAAKVAVLT